MSSHTMIILDMGKDSEIDKYLHKFETIMTLNLLGLFSRMVTNNFLFPLCRNFLSIPLA